MDPVASWTSALGTGRGLALLVLGVALAAGVVGGTTVALLDGTGSTRTAVVTQTVAAPLANGASATSERALPLSIGAIYRQDGPGVVRVTSISDPRSQAVSPGFTPPAAGIVTRHGSGFVLDGDGYILTNEHIVGREGNVSVSFSNRDDVPAHVVGVDPSTDLALLKVDMLANALHPLVLGDSNQAEVGDTVVAIGNPFGVDRTVTAGIVSAVQRRIRAPNGFTIPNVIQTDAPISSGSAGGPLIDQRGAVIGINARVPESSGVGFAIPIDVAKQVIAQLRDSGRVEHAYLGVDGAAVDRVLAQNTRVAATSGVLVEGIAPDSPAAAVPLHTGSTPTVFNGTTYCLGGDVITRIDGKSLTGFDQLTNAVAAKAPGDRLVLTVAHADGSTSNVDVVLGRQPARMPGIQTSCGTS
jgi:S1-C subfamily serine protease